MKKISNFMIFSIFLTVVGAPAMSMTSHTIKANDAKKKKRRRIIGGLAAGVATLAAGAAAYKYRNNISKAAYQMRGKPATATATAKPAQTKDTQTKHTSSERRDAIKQVKTDNKPMETKPETTTNNTVPVPTVPTNSKTASQSEAPQNRRLLSNSQSTEGAIYGEKGVGVSNKAPKGAQPRAPKDSTNKTQAPTKTAVQAPASAPQSEASQTRAKTRAEMERDGDLVYNAQGAAGNKNAPQAPKFDPEKMQKRLNIAKPDATKTTQVPKNTEAPAPAKTMEQQLQEAQAKMKKVDKEKLAAGNAAAAEKKRAAEVSKQTPQQKNLQQQLAARKKLLEAKRKHSASDDEDDDSD